jgi:DNA polymerase
MFITLDFETFYDSKIKLGFKHQTTEEYIRDKRFEVIGVGVKFDGGEAKWVTGTKDEIAKYLSTLPWDDSEVLCHNMLFDGAILSWIYGIKPKALRDTLCMARALHGVDVGGSLASLALRYGIGVKGDEVVAAEGKRRLDFTKEELDQYGRYCVNDVDLTYNLWKLLAENFPQKELDLIDMTIRMFTEPVLTVDDAMLDHRLLQLDHERIIMYGRAYQALGGENTPFELTDVPKKLHSNKQFGELLKSMFGIDPPMKISPTTGKPTLALAKKDEGFLALLEHENEEVQMLCAVRLNTKSTLEETRCQRFIDVAKRNRGRIPIPLKYYGAHTGRWSGTDKVNFQNLPSRDKTKKTLKNAIYAPDGYMVINCDSSQIEARILAWLAGQDDVVEQFAKGEDVYSIFASEVYNMPITKANPEERFVGKTCILGLGYGTGATKLQHTLATAQPISVKVSDEESKRIVKIYRDKNKKIVKLWGEGDKMLDGLYTWDDEESSEFDYGEHGVVKVNKTGIRLPNGLYIRYPELDKKTDEGQTHYVYKSRRGEIPLWGGSIVENVVQALARIVVGEQMLAIQRRYRVVLTVHDAAVCVVPEAEKDEALAYIMECMSTPPDWGKDLPITCEASVAHSYGEC